MQRIGCVTTSTKTILEFQSFLEWSGDKRTEPTCWGNCGGRNSGWSLDRDTGYWVCGQCEKPSRSNLRQCPVCEEVWLPDKPTPVTKYRAHYHPECAEYAGVYIDGDDTRDRPLEEAGF